MKKPLDTPKEVQKEVPKLRQIIIETDGKEIWIRKAETSKIELAAICNIVIQSMAKKEQTEQTQ